MPTQISIQYLLKRKLGFDNFSMIIVRFNGGLGNQMFQYAVAKKLALKYKVKLFADLKDYNGASGHPFSLSCFGLQLFEPPKSVLNLFDSFNSDFYLKIRRFFMKPVYLKESNFTFNPNAFNKAGKYSYLDGYWQSEKYFMDCRDILLEDFKFILKPSKETENILDEINSNNSVSLHIRRGDYVKNPTTLKVHGVCALDYYKRAISHINNLIDMPYYFIFSDDIEWAKGNLTFSNKVKFVDHTSVNNSWEDMLMMQNCKHNIIANSTFSWWGAWLNRNSVNIVIAPKEWFADKCMQKQTGDLIPENWIRL